jgi:membrane fusion protein (multidrug efflux system)
MMHNMNKLQIIVSLFVAGLFTGCGSSGQDSTSETKMPPGISAKILVVAPEPLQHKITVTGSVLANESVELRAETSVIITRLNFEEGTFVRKGFLLEKINDRDLQAQLKKLILQDSLMSRDEYRKRKLLEIKAISREEYEMVQTELETVRAEQEVVKTQIERTDVIAPFSGMVGLRQVSEGAYVDASTLIATLQQIDPVRIEFAVPEKYRAHLMSGTAVQFSVTGVDSTFLAEVYAVESRIDPATRSVTARARSQNPGKLLFPGAFARMELILENIPDALLVPAEAVVPEMNRHKVFVVRNGKAEAVEVTTGIRTEHRTQITSGIEAGDSVAVIGLLQLREGSKVNVQ